LRGRRQLKEGDLESLPGSFSNPEGSVMTGKRRARILVQGRVQGVFFRDSTRRVAIRLGLSGTVRNVPAGDVEIVAEGTAEQLDSLIEWCRTGPPAAVVDDVKVVYGESTGEFEGFRIVY